jgi:DNA gyrase subunit A
LQATVSVILLALDGNRPQLMTVRMLLDAFIRHRVDVIRRRTEFLLREARRRKHTVEGLLLAQTDIDRIIRTIRESASRAAARDALQQVAIPAPLVSRALGESGYASYVSENGEATEYFLSANQAEAIVSMQLGSLANLEREKLAAEHQPMKLICEQWCATIWKSCVLDFRIDDAPQFPRKNWVTMTRKL